MAQQASSLNDQRTKRQECSTSLDPVQDDLMLQMATRSRTIAATIMTFPRLTVVRAVRRLWIPSPLYSHFQTRWASILPNRLRNDGRVMRVIETTHPLTMTSLKLFKFKLVL